MAESSLVCCTTPELCRSIHRWGEGSPNYEMDERTFLLNRERAVDYLNMLDRMYVFDGFACWDPEVRIWIWPVRHMRADLKVRECVFESVRLSRVLVVVRIRANHTCCCLCFLLLLAHCC